MDNKFFRKILFAWEDLRLSTITFFLYPFDSSFQDDDYSYHKGSLFAKTAKTKVDNLVNKKLRVKKCLWFAYIQT